MTEMRTAARDRRVTARLIDLVLEFGAGGMLTIAWIDWAVDRTDTEWSVFGLLFWSAVVLVAFMALYEVAFVAWRGQTPGKMITRIRVVKARTGGRVGVLRSLARLVPLMMIVIPVVGYVGAAVAYGWAMLDEEGRGWHDRLAGTRVVAAS